MHDRVTPDVNAASLAGWCAPRIYIEDVYPAVDAGRFAVKRVAAEPVDVWADIFRDGHALLAAELLWKHEGANRWSRAPMRLVDNDRWIGSFVPSQAGRYLFGVEAWTNVIGTWRRDVIAKEKAGLDLSLEL